MPEWLLLIRSKWLRVNSEYISAQSCSKSGLERLQVRPTPSGSTLRDFTTEFSTIMEYLRTGGRERVDRCVQGQCTTLHHTAHMY